MFNFIDGFIKVAEKKKPFSKRFGEATGVIVGQSAVNIGSVVGGMVLSQKALKGLAAKATPESGAIMRGLGRQAKKAKLPVHKSGLSYYMPKHNLFYLDRHIGLPRRATPMAFAHELGHAARKRIIPEKFMLTTAQSAGKKYNRVFGAYAALGAAGVLLTGGEKNRKRAKQIAEVGAVGSAALATPMIYEELAATGSGVRKLRQAGASWKHIAKALPKMLKATSSYLPMAYGPALGLYGISKLIKSKKEKNK